MWKWNLAIVGIVSVGIFVMFQVMLGLSSIEKSPGFDESDQLSLENDTTATTDTSNISVREQVVIDWDEVLVRTATLPLRINENEFLASVAITNEERVQGLSATTELPVGIVKLFDFEFDYQWGIWMKEMSYPIDILWLDSSKTIVHIENNVLPETYPEVFTSPIPARYVLEIQAGLAQNIGLRNGDIAEFNL